MELDFLEIFGTLVGLVYLWLEYRASIYLWIAGVVMPAIYIFVLQGGTVCRLWHQYLLSDSRCLRLVFLDVGTPEKEVPAGRPANRRSLQRPPYRAHSVEMLPSTGSCIHCRLYRHCMDTYRIYRQ